MDHPQLKIIGTLHCGIHSLQEAPKNYDISEHTGTIEIESQYHEALDGIEKGQTVVVLCWLHQADRDVLTVYPRGDRSRGLRGVFATRSPARPNPIAISEFEILERRDTLLMVKGLDIIDGTPVIDIKKKI